MPNYEPQVFGGSKGYLLRHVGPKADIWPNPAANVATFPLLGQASMIARPLPASDVPGSPDYQQGAWTGRFNDAGDATITFPNATSSDGTPWRNRFDSGGHNQFLEVYNDGYLESVFCIVVPNLAQDAVTIAGSDGFFLLKKAYETDWTVVLSPRDVCERGTQVWIGVIADDFPGSNVAGVEGTLDALWTPTPVGFASIVVQPFGGVQFSVGGSEEGNSAEIATANVPCEATGVWTATCGFANINIGASVPDVGSSVVFMTVTESSGDQYVVQLASNADSTVFGSFTGGVSGGQVNSQLATAPSYGFSIVSDGEWVSGYINGQYLGTVRRTDPVTSGLALSVTVEGGPANAFAFLTSALVKCEQPFLMRGLDRGDYVLPGNQSTYPNGGLHGRYYNDLDLANADNRLDRILNYTRSQAYGGQGSIPEYANSQDGPINGQANPLTDPADPTATTGASTQNWSVKEFGAIWLQLSSGDYEFEVEVPTPDAAIRVWVGDLRWGMQLVDQWDYNNTALSYGFTVSASSTLGSLGVSGLRGSLPYGAGTIARDGWYCIRIEYSVDATPVGLPALYLLSSPAAYTDPGGTAIAAGPQGTVFPATSMSPLGCIDQRYQGQSHFDLVQQTLNAVDLQASLEPYRLESGLFPGVLAPRIREGKDTDIILTPEVNAGDSLTNYSSQADASDFVASLQGNGAGFQNQQSGQLQAEVFDVDTISTSLFNVQGWQDFSDAAFSELLQALLNSQLGLRLTPWQLLSADPLVRNRRALANVSNMWPLPGEIAQMRWRPGDGIRVRALDIAVWDTAPRQILTIQRSFAPGGVTGTTVGWANRPRGPVHAQRQLFYSVSRQQRNNQSSVTTLTSSAVDQNTIPAQSLGNASVLALSPGDNVVSAGLRIPYNTGNVQFGIYVNGVDVSGVGPPPHDVVLNGPWQTCPVNIDITPALRIGADATVNIQVFNNDPTNASVFHYQAFINVQR